MIVPSLACLLTDSIVGRAFAQRLVKANLLPELVLLHKPMPREDAPSEGTGAVVARVFEKRKQAEGWGELSYSKLYRTFDPEVSLAQTIESAQVECVSNPTAEMLLDHAPNSLYIVSDPDSVSDLHLDSKITWLEVVIGRFPERSLFAEWAVILGQTFELSVLVHQSHTVELAWSETADTPKLEEGQFPKLYGASKRAEALAKAIRRFARLGELSGEAARVCSPYDSPHPVLMNVARQRLENS